MASPAENEAVEAVDIARDVLANRRSHDVCDQGECFYPTVLRLAAALRAQAEAGVHLARIIEYRPCLRFDVIPCDQRAEMEEVEWCPLCVARAALTGEGTE